MKWLLFGVLLTGCGGPTSRQVTACRVRCEALGADCQYAGFASPFNDTVFGVDGRPTACRCRCDFPLTPAADTRGSGRP